MQRPTRKKPLRMAEQWRPIGRSPPGAMAQPVDRHSTERNRNTANWTAPRTDGAAKPEGYNAKPKGLAFISRSQ